MKLLLVLAALAAFAGLVESQNCSPTRPFECDNGQCIPYTYICDGDNDCGDGSDESDDPEGCPACRNKDHFTCASGRCIPKANACDGFNHCGDGSDEPPSINPELCPACDADEFRCDNGKCIPYRYICDRTNDCGDDSDESDDSEGCPACQEEAHFTCTSGRCIPKANACDGEYNCGDRSDEPENPDDCPACNVQEYRCGNGWCVDRIRLCDGENDCGDGSDERQDCPGISKAKNVSEIRREFQKNKLMAAIKQQRKAREPQKTGNMSSNNSKYRQKLRKARSAGKKHQHFKNVSICP